VWAGILHSNDFSWATTPSFSGVTTSENNIPKQRTHPKYKTQEINTQQTTLLFAHSWPSGEGVTSKPNSLIP